MHPIRITAAALNITACEAMNLLQDHGIISDNAVEPEDVGPGDAAKAVRWLRDNVVKRESVIPK